MQKRIIRGLSTTFAFLSAIAIAGELIATSSTDYKQMVDGFFGVNNSVSGNLGAYNFTSEFKNTKELYSKRKSIAEQIVEEGCVLLKNENQALPLIKEGKNEVSVTILGSRAFTYDQNGNLRDSSLSVYGGIVGSKIYKQKVTTTEGTFDVPIPLDEALESAGIHVNPSSKKVYSKLNFPNLVKGSEANGSQGASYSVNEPFVQASDFSDTASYSDAAIVVIGRSSGEGREYLPGKNGIEDASDGSKSALNLSNNERNLIKEAKKISSKVIVLINSAVAMEINELKEGELANSVDSILWIGLPGSYGMNGVARLLSGQASPSGHLPDTYAVDASASPAAQNFGVTAQDNSGSFTWKDAGIYTRADNGHYVVLAEGLYTGYYYYETRYADCVENRGNASSPVGLGREAKNNVWAYENEVSYPFGFGLSYTSFHEEFVPDEKGNIVQYLADTNQIQCTVRVTNTGDVAGKHAVQLYASSPYTSYDQEHKIEKSAIQLVTFDKTDTLYPASMADAEHPNSMDLTLTADLKYFASYDKTASHDGKVGGYILEDAPYYFAIGNGAHAALNSVLLKKEIPEQQLYQENGTTSSKELAFAWNPAKEETLTSQSRGGFTNGVNATLLNQTSDGVLIENQLSDADYNYFAKDSITYLSRSSYADTFPKPYTQLPVQDGMRKFLGTEESNAGRVYDFQSGGSSGVEFGVDHSEEEDEMGNPKKNRVIAEYKELAYDDPSWDELLEQITFDEAWKFSPYGGTSCKPFKSVNAPEVWQIDGPNGNVTRGVGAKAATSGPLSVSKNDPNFSYMSADMPCEPVTAATFHPDLLEEQGENYGEDGLWGRNGIAWAPGMNLHRTPFNSRNHEYYSEDPMLTNISGTSFIRGGLKKGMILSAKHFAFNTQESFREGLTQFMEEQSARELELRGFQGITQDVHYVNSLGNEIQGLGMMTSFSRIGVCGVNAHTGLMENILRKEWGYKGLSSTDMVVEGRFFNPQDSIINHVTFMATSNAKNLLSNYWKDYNDKNKVRKDPNLVKALYENMHYYMYALANSHALNGMDASTTIVTDVMSPWEYLLIGTSIGTGTVAVLLYGFYTYLTFRKKKNITKETEVKE